MKEIELKVELRQNGKGTKKELSTLRTARMIPAVVYGGDKPPVSVVVSEKDLTKATKSGGANAILHLKHAKGDDTVILKMLQRHAVSLAPIHADFQRISLKEKIEGKVPFRHAVSLAPIHADFQRISLKEKIEVKVPIHVVGEAPGVKLHGGILEHVLRELRVRALPTAIPQKIDVDVSALELNMNVLVKDVKVPKDLEVLDASDHIVLNVVQPTAEAAPATPEGEAAAAAEPEVIAKGKKEEEGAEGAEKGKAAAAPAKGAAPAAAGGEKKKEGK
jgi:large subunit ribosomal protein L25